MLIPCAGGRAIMLRKLKVVIGRAPDCDVVIPNKIVSSRHCQLEFINGYWQAVDLDSRNGTFVDGIRYRTKWVFPGHILGLSTQRFRAEYVAQGERPSANDDDIPVLSQKSLMECVGLTEEKLDALVPPKDLEELIRRRWQIDDV
jgi:pSer/pThr/pTyr-binding forkhead associated (FHA) protein